MSSKVTNIQTALAASREHERALNAEADAYQQRAIKAEAALDAEREKLRGLVDKLDEAQAEVTKWKSKYADVAVEMDATRVLRQRTYQALT